MDWKQSTMRAGHILLKEVVPSRSVEWRIRRSKMIWFDDQNFLLKKYLRIDASVFRGRHLRAMLSELWVLPRFVKSATSGLHLQSVTCCKYGVYTLRTQLNDFLTASPKENGNSHHPVNGSPNFCVLQGFAKSVTSGLSV